MPRFSVVIPCFNAAATLGDTLTAILSQSCADLEVICVDDGSTDATCEIVARIGARDPRVRLAHNPGKGPSSARNHGAATLAQGNIIAFCDADDIWTPDKLADLAMAFGDDAVDGVFGRIGFFKTMPGDRAARSSVPDRPLSIAMLLGENPVCTLSNMAIRRSVFLASGGFNPMMVHNEDLDWLIRLTGNGARIVGRDALHVWYRTSVGGLSSDLAAMRQGREQALASAARFGAHPSPASEAVHLRYLARRALRLGQGGLAAWALAWAGLRASPAGFLTPPRRGAPTLIAALLAVVLPRRLCLALFAR